MEKITWDEHFSMGIDEIDRQHKQLVKMVNEMLDLGGVTVTSEKVSDVLTRMTEYADYHFSSEEKLMQSSGFPEFKAHALEHAAFMRKTAELAMGTMQEHQAVPQELLAYLKEWLVNHILESDMRYKPYFMRRNPGS